MKRLLMDFLRRYGLSCRDLAFLAGGYDTQDPHECDRAFSVLVRAASECSNRRQDDMDLHCGDEEIAEDWHRITSTLLQMAEWSGPEIDSDPSGERDWPYLQAVLTSNPFST